MCNAAHLLEYPSSNFEDTLTILFLFMGCWALRMSTACCYDRSAIGVNCCCVQSQNWQITVFGQQNSRCIERSSKLGNVAVPPSLEYWHATLVQTDTEVAEKYASQWYAVPLLPILVILWLFVSNLWATGCHACRPLVAIDQSPIAANFCCLHGQNLQITFLATKFYI